MSPDNVERLRAYCEAWGTDANPDLSLLDPSVTYEDRVLPDHVGETYRGREGVMRATLTWLEPYESFEFELERIIGTGDRLVSIHRFRGTGRSSGIKNEIRYAYAWTFRGGLITHFVAFRTPEEALEAAGLSG